MLDVDFLHIWRDSENRKATTGIKVLHLHSLAVCFLSTGHIFIAIYFQIHLNNIAYSMFEVIYSQPSLQRH